MVVRRVAASTPIQLEEIDISDDPELEALYGTEIPVLMMGGTKVAKFRISEPDLRRALRGATGIGGKSRVRPVPTLPACLGVYLAVMMKCPRRFCCQQSSVELVQNGCSFPLLTTVMRFDGIPRLTR